MEARDDVQVAYLIQPSFSGLLVTCAYLPTPPHLFTANYLYERARCGGRTPHNLASVRYKTKLTNIDLHKNSCYSTSRLKTVRPSIAAAHLYDRSFRNHAKGRVYCGLRVLFNP
jgi:hypothetical protein